MDLNLDSSPSNYPGPPSTRSRRGGSVASALAQGSHKLVPVFLGKLNERPARLVDRLPTFPTALIWKIHRTHDVIHAFATDFATRALDCVADGAASAGPSTEVALSPLKYFRFCRAFYRVESFYTLFQYGLFGNNMDNWFFFETSVLGKRTNRLCIRVLASKARRSFSRCRHP
ncbi:hypothetical protein N657DRAFT_175510 [Parathielavia appendiculata]|uniref:Uncharacterized protein n=1 Tax=Parathielavia appendiculata TaxID=2587402 RepID=A0AAN6Z6U6_9PEZI|nr:hypothetical protein N657DRAFT_175510 [Parathielavia appendiculata]